MTDTAKALFEEELLDWEKEYYTTCNTDSNSISCRDAYALKRDEEVARTSNSTSYYTMTAEERGYFDGNRTSDVAALEATLAAAWLSENAPTAGEAGSSCETDACTDSTHCCGTSTPRSGAYVTPTLDNICVDSSTLEYTDGLGRIYDHVCANAMKMLATSTAALAAMYSLA